MKKLKVYSNPQFTDTIPRDTMGMCITFDAKIREAEGYICLYLPV